MDVVSENCPRVDGQKSWCMLVAHNSRKQKSYLLHQPLQRVDCNTSSHWQNNRLIPLFIGEEVYNSFIYCNHASESILGYALLAHKNTDFFPLCLPLIDINFFACKIISLSPKQWTQFPVLLHTPVITKYLILQVASKWLNWKEVVIYPSYELFSFTFDFLLWFPVSPPESLFYMI